MTDRRSNDYLTAVQNGVTAANNLAQLLTQATVNSSSLRVQIAGVSTGGVTSFNGRTGTVIPSQGDYPTALIPGTTAATNATAGNIGEYITSTVFSTTPVGSIVSASNFNITSISLTPGDWDVRGLIGVLPSSQLEIVIGWISSQSQTFDPISGGSALVEQFTSFGTLLNAGRFSANVGPRQFLTANTTTCYLSVQATFTTSCQFYGFLGARRMR